MARKFSDIEEEEKKSLENELYSKSQAIGMDAYESYGNDIQTGLKALLGMCANCKNLNYCKTEFGTVYAICSQFEYRLTGKNRITECNLHSPMGVLSLSEMYAIAYLIDPNKDKKIEGFISKKE